MAADTLSLDDEFQALYIPKPKRDLEIDVAAMSPVFQTYPPLGQVTCTDKGSVDIQAVLRVPELQSHGGWEIVLWYSADKSEWLESQLQPSDSTVRPQDFQVSSESATNLYFHTNITFTSSLSFTAKFRHGSGAKWTWVRDEYGHDDGIVIRTTPHSTSSDISDLIKDMNPEWTVKERMSQAPGTRLYSLETQISCPKDEESHIANIRVGTPWGSVIRWFALVRQSAPWLAPRHGKSHVSLDKDAVLCAFLGPGGRYLVFLAVSGINDTTSVMRYASNALIFHARCDAVQNSGSSPGTLLVAEGDNFDCAVAAVMYHARNLVSVQTNAEPPHEEDSLAAQDQDAEPMWMENWYDGIGYCTWNSLGQELTEEKLLHALDSLADNNIEISNLIIDDNWQSIDTKEANQFNRGWLDFEANPASFPNGLKATVQQIRQKHRNVRYIAVWHALLGYWGGISPDGKLAKTYKTIELDRQDAGDGELPLGGKMTVIARDDVARFYTDFYNFLRYAGVNAVKTDAQFMVDSWTNSKARRELITEYLDVWGLNALRYFSMRAVSCMSQFPQALFHSQMKSAREACLVRSSDDYFPDVPQSHAWHIWANAHNSIFMQHLNVVPDWDMFQTKHEFGEYHAAARCLSGGPIWITDVPGEHDINVIRQISGRTTRGKTVIFRPSVVGKSVSPLTGYHDNVLLKIGTYHGASHTGTPILGIFNVSQRPLVDIIPLSVFPGIIDGLQYVIRAHTSGKVSDPITPGSSGAFLTTSLDVGGYEILTAVPLGAIISEKHGTISIGNMGLVGKMTGCAAITSHVVAKRNSGRVFIDTNMKALGVLGLYISSLDNMTIDDDFMVTIQGQPIPRHTIRISKEHSLVLEVDLEAAWEEMQLHSGWSNEVQVKITCNS